MIAPRSLLLIALLITTVALGSPLEFLPAASEGHSARLQETLDDPQPDTLLYDDGNPSFLWPGTNYWIRVDFTAPDTFELRSVYFYTTNFPAAAGPCSVWVHEYNAGELGAVLDVHTVPTLLDGGFNDGNLTSPVTFNPGEQFFIVLGPIPGGDQQVAWVPMIDGSSTGHGALGTSGHYGTYDPAVPGDWMVRCGGEVASFTDLEATECWNVVNSSDPSFFLLPGDEVQLGGAIENVGSEDVEDYTLTWVVDGPSGEIYNESETGGAVAAGGTAELTAPTTFTVTAEGEYLATCTVTNENDGVAGNNSIGLRFFVGDTPSWFRYDDNEANTFVNPSTGTGWGVSYTPPSYTARIESIRVNFGGDGDAAVGIFLNEDGTPSGTSIWEATPTVETGWNSISVDPAVNIYDGQSFTVATLFSDVSTGKDDDPPNEAGISHMSGVGWTLAGTWVEDPGGNWCIQVYLDTSSAEPPFPVIEVDVEELVFGTVPINNPAELSFWVANRGGIDPLIVTDISVVPPSIRDIYTFDPPDFQVAAGESLEVTVTFAPEIVDRPYNGLATINNNSENNTAYQILIRGTGGEPDAAETPESGVPTEFALGQNFPNPFNPTTHIQFALPAASEVKLTVFNTLGQQVNTLASGSLPAGFHSVELDASALTAGIYFYRLEAGSFTETRKMMLLK